MTIYFSSRTKQEFKNYQKGWAQAFGKYQGSIYLVPSETQEIIVQYDPHLQISCVIPPTTRQLSLHYSTVSVSDPLYFPSLLFSQLILNRSSYCGDYNPCFCRNCQSDPHLITCFCDFCKNIWRRSFKKYYLYQYQGPFSDFELNYLNFPNVDRGLVCFGSATPPKNLRQANNHFWASPFNIDYLSGYYYSSRNCNNKKYHPYSSWSLHNVKHGLSSAQPCRRQIVHNCTCSCPYKDLNHEVGCRYRHQSNSCSCFCICKCCQSKLRTEDAALECQELCHCECCRKTCACNCECNHNLDLAVNLQHSLDITRSTDRNLKLAILGIQHLVHVKTDGVFFSEDAKILKRIDPAFHKTDRSYHRLPNQKFIIGWAKAISDNEWEVTFEDGQVMLFSEKEVSLA